MRVVKHSINTCTAFKRVIKLNLILGMFCQFKNFNAQDIR